MILRIKVKLIIKMIIAIIVTIIIRRTRVAHFFAFKEGITKTSI